MVDLKTARDATIFAVRIPIGVGMMLAERLPAPVGPAMDKVLRTVASALPDASAPAEAAEASRTAPAPEPATPAPDGPVKPHGDPVRPSTETPPPAPATSTAAEIANEEQSSVTTPVGTTGADVGHNPDTTETDLQQTGTEPLLDPSTAKAVASESATLSKAADPHADQKG